MITSRNEQAVAEIAGRLKNQGLNAIGISADVSNPADLKKLFQYTIKEFGKIDVWINNAGLSGGYRYLHDLTSEEISDIINTNLTGLVDACRMILDYFINQKGGILINMSGRGGRSESSPYTAVYACTKAAISNLTKSLAAEYRKYPVSIHYVLPGMMQTDFYVDIKVSRGFENTEKTIRLVMNAFGTPLDTVARLFVKISGQKPGRFTGKAYSTMNSVRMLIGIGKMIWYRITGKIKS